MNGILSFDIEEWFHPEIFNGIIPPENWEKLPTGVERGVEAILNILDKNRAEATFFILGWVAERFPELVRAIAAQGHEIASHGYRHRMITQMSPEIFEADLKKSLDILNKLSREPVIGFRAPTFSVVKETLWSLPIMARLGIRYDSSVFPIYHDRYGIPDAPRTPYVIYRDETTEITEFPMPTVQLLNYRLPVGGGGYFRIYPFALTKALLKQVSKQQINFIFYAHPWEFDTRVPRVKLSYLSKLRHYYGIEKMEKKLEWLLKEINFTSFRTHLKEPVLYPAGKTLNLH